jgi:hypothetical protein
MKLKKYTKPDQLERYSFLWSEARLVIAAIALFSGGVPVVYLIFPASGLYRILSPFLTLTWLISGLASGYLLYRWNDNKQRLFRGKKNIDTGAFFVSVVSGINLGIAGLLGTNVGMAISSNRFILTVVALLYLAAAIYLFMRWNASKRKIF